MLWEKEGNLGGPKLAILIRLCAFGKRRSLAHVVVDSAKVSTHMMRRWIDGYMCLVVFLILGSASPLIFDSWDIVLLRSLLVLKI